MSALLAALVRSWRTSTAGRLFENVICCFASATRSPRIWRHTMLSRTGLPRMLRFVAETVLGGRGRGAVEDVDDNDAGADPDTAAPSGDATGVVGAAAELEQKGDADPTHERNNAGENTGLPRRNAREHIIILVVFARPTMQRAMGRRDNEGRSAPHPVHL